MSWPHEPHTDPRPEDFGNRFGNRIGDGYDDLWDHLPDGLFGEIFAEHFAALPRERGDLNALPFSAPLAARAAPLASAHLDTAPIRPAPRALNDRLPTSETSLGRTITGGDLGAVPPGQRASFAGGTTSDQTGAFASRDASAPGRGAARRAGEARLPYFPVEGRGLPTIGVSVPRIRSRWSTALPTAGPTGFPSALASCSTLMERVLRGIRLFADEADCRLLLFPGTETDEDVFRTASAAGARLRGLGMASATRPAGRADTFLDGSISGLILAPQAADQRPSRLARAGLPVVLLGPAGAPVAPGCGAIHLDERETAHLALGHLWGLGHRRVACLTVPSPTVSGAATSAAGLRLMDPLGLPDAPAAAGSFFYAVTHQRFQHYAAWMRRHQSYDPALIGSLGTWDSHEYLQRLLAGWMALPSERRPTAVFCTQEGMGHAVLAAARAIGLRVPRDLSIVAVDTEAAAMAYADVPVTCVEIPAEELGEAAIRLLSDIFRARYLALREASRYERRSGTPGTDVEWPAAPTRAVYATRLILRASTAAVGLP